MSIDFDASWIISTILLWVRVGTVFLMSPWYSAAKAPVPFTLLLTLVISGFLVATGGSSMPLSVNQPVALIWAVLCELVTGAVLGFSLQCAFAAISIAGQVLDIQIGFGMGAVFNPVTKGRSPVLGTLMSLFAVAFFFAIEGHHAVLRALIFSTHQVPLGSAWFLGSAGSILRPVGAMFTTAVLVISPALFILLLIEIVLSFASRTLPQMNVFFVGVPAKILSGIAILAATSSIVGPVMIRSYRQVFQHWDGVLR